MPCATEVEIVVGSFCCQKELQISDILQVQLSAGLVIMSENPKDYSILRKKSTLPLIAVSWVVRGLCAEFHISSGCTGLTQVIYLQSW